MHRFSRLASSVLLLALVCLTVSADAASLRPAAGEQLVAQASIRATGDHVRARSGKNPAQVQENARALACDLDDEERAYIRAAITARGRVPRTRV